MKRILSFVLTLCLIVGLLPAVTLFHAHADVETATLTLWGTSTTINAGESLYWTNNGSAQPAAATADDNWNYSLAIVDGDVVFTMRNAEYSYTGASFLYASFDGTLRINYEGVNNINISKTVANKRYFAKHAGSAAGKAWMYLQGGEDDVLNVTGGGNSTGLLHTSKSKMYIVGGTVNLQKTAGASYPVIVSHYIGMEIRNCNLSATQLGTAGNSYPVIYGAYNTSGHHLIIQDSNVTVKGPNSVGICAGVFLASLKGTESTANLYIKGKSDVKIELNTTDAMLSGSYSTYRYMGAGIYCRGLYIEGGSLEVSSRKNAINFYSSSTTGPNLSSYDGEYKMFTEKDGAAVKEFTITPYFKLMEKLPCEHKNTTQTEVILDEPTCGETGHKQVTVFCHDCVEEVGTYEAAIPATKAHNYDAVTGICGVCGDVEIPVEGPTWPTDVVFATPEQMANVVLEKKASAGGTITAHPGGKITYKLFITNNNAEAINVHIEDMIPKYTTLVSGCDYTSGRALYFVEKDIAPGETRIITYNVKPDFTIAEVRASEFDIILTNHDAKVMDVTVPATEDIWVLETFNDEDIRKMEMAIDALVTANLTAKYSNIPLNRIQLAAMMYNVGFTVGTGLGTTDPNEIFTLIFEKAGAVGSGSTSGGVEDVVDKGQNLLDRVPPHLYGGTAVPAEKDELFRGARATEVTINDLITGDLLFVKNNGETKMYIVDGAKLVYLGKTEVIRAIDPATVLPGLTASEQFVVIRPSINLNITFALQEGEYFNDADKNGYTETEKAIIATAEAYILRGDRAQYTDDMTGTSLYRWESGVKQPEYYTVDQYGYTNCAAFTYDANYMTTGSKPAAGNTTANNASYAKKYWDVTTGTSSSADVVFYAEPMVKDEDGKYVETLDEAGKAAIKEQIISLLRPGDIINIRRTKGSGHAMLYVGNGTIIHSSGSNYSNDNMTDTHEATIRFRMVEDLFDPDIYATTSCVYYLASFSILRPSANKTANTNAQNRMNNMQGIIGEKVASTAMGKTVNCGDEITYTFYVFNTNMEDKVITITDELSEHVTFVSATDNAVVDGSNISWNVTVPADTRVAITYTVKVNEGVPQFAAIDGSKAKINGVMHKCIDSWVANTLDTTEQQTVLDAVAKVQTMDLTGLNNVQIAELIYEEAFGIEHIFGGKVTNGRELVGGDTDNNYSTKGVDNMGVFNDTWYWESSNKTSVSWMPNYNTSAAAQMVAPGMYAGQLVYPSSYNKNNRDERQNRYLNVADGALRSRYFWEKDLVVGDIFMMGGSTSVYLYIYLGNDTLLFLNDMTTKSVAARFEYAPSTTWKYLAVMRPSFVFEEAHNVVEIPATGNCIEGGTTAGKECADCGLHLVEPLDVPAGEHTEEIIPGKDATCSAPGLTEGKKCSVCGEILTAQEEIKALGHTEKTDVETKAATCTEAGYTKTTVTCTVCGETISETTEEIKALGHTEETIPGKAPTATEPGLTEGKKCSVCGEILVKQEEIPATGPVECTHTYTDDNDAVCNNCGFVRQMVDTFDFVNYRIVFADSDTTHKNPRVEFYKLGDKTVADPTSESALRAIDAGYKTYWGAEINTILATDAGNYVALLKYNVGTATVKVPLVINVDADPKLIIDKNNKLTVLDSNEDEIHGHLRVYVYYLGDQTVEDIYDEAALQAIDPDAAKSENIIYHKMFIDKTALTKGGNYVVHLCWNIGTGPKITKAQQFTVFAIPTLTLDVNNMLWMTDDNAENNSHRLTIYKMADDFDFETADIYDENAVKKAAVSTSKTYWGAAEINGLEIYERGNYIIHLYYSVGSSAKRTIAIGSYLSDRPVAGVTDENKLSMSFTDPDITNERVYYYYFGENTAEGLDIYDKAALQKAAVSYTSSAIWTKNTINKTTLKELGNYVIHFEYNVKTYNEDGTAAGSAKKVVVVEATIYNPTKPVATLGEGNKLVVEHNNPDATNIRATIYNLGDETVEDIYNETALKAIDSAAKTKWGVAEINKTALTEGNNYVVLVKYNLGTQTRTVAFQFSL